MNGWEVFVSNTHLEVGNGRRVKFWKNVWCGGANLRDSFPSIYHMATDRNATVFYYLQYHDGVIEWDNRLRRDVRDWEEETSMELLVRVYGLERVGEGRDKIRLERNLED